VSFVHDDPDFPRLLAIVSRETGVAAALVEKDYWVTHCLWALHEAGIELWLKGGTSLSKGFGLIRRFSEDLDLMVQRGTVASLPAVTNWTSTNKGPVAARRAFYDALPDAFAIPAVKIDADTSRHDKQARGIDLIGRYPGVLLDRLSPTMSPFVRFEIGRARVVPFVEMPLTSLGLLENLLRILREGRASLSAGGVARWLSATEALVYCASSVMGSVYVSTHA